MSDDTALSRYDEEHPYDEERPYNLRNEWIQASLDGAGKIRPDGVPLDTQITAALATLDERDTVYLIYNLVTDVTDMCEALSISNWPIDMAALARRVATPPGIGPVLYYAYLAAAADHDNPDWWPAWLDAREVLDVPAAEQLLADWVTDRIRRAGMAPEGIRRVTLSDGRTVAVDADDPNRDEAIRQAYEEGGR